jgi:hypothetical protein
MVDINEGRTGANGVPAAIAGFIGLLFLVYSPLIAFMFFGICAFLATITEGIIIDTKLKRYKKYYRLAGLRTGNWNYFKSVECIELKRNIDSVRVTRWLPSGKSNESAYATEKSSTFNILLKENGDTEILYEFYKYKHALLALNTISTLLQIEKRDYFEEDLIASENRS